MNRDFKGVWIPREIWLDKRLNANCKCLLTEIDSLDCCNESGDGCYAGNQYFAEFLNVSERCIGDCLATLTTLGLIKTVSFDGRKRYIKSLISDFKDVGKEDLQNLHSADSIESQNLPSSIENLSKSSIKNNTMNNTLQKSNNKKEIKPLVQNTDFVYLYDYEIEKLNNKYGKDIIKIYIAKLDNYIGSTGKQNKYKSHYHTIKNWLLREGIKEIAKSNKLMCPKCHIEVPPHRTCLKCGGFVHEN